MPPSYAYRVYGPEGSGFYEDYPAAVFAAAGKPLDRVVEEEGESEYRQLVSIVDTGVGR